MTTGVNSVSATSTAAANTARTRIADNFDSFLLLLTTQLQNQNPLEPLDTNQFTQQLVQFAQVEQQIQSNQTLEGLLAASRATERTHAMGFVGREVSIEASATQSAGPQGASWNFTPPREGRATITVRDASGRTVYSEQRQVGAGNTRFDWNGRTSEGQSATLGDYTVSVAVTDVTGRTVAAPIEIRGRVTGATLDGAEPMITVNGQPYPVSKVRAITGV
jgi:flagellar basal-body rod modification protein FlgD